ncbi:MAG: hypothetical protein ACLQLG_18665 [Thermoguttaceae bacterium]
MPIDLESLHTTVTGGFARLQTLVESGFANDARRLDEHDKMLKGNGKPGVIVDIKTLQERLDGHLALSNRRLGWAIAAAGTLGGVAMTWLLGIAWEMAKAWMHAHP